MVPPLPVSVVIPTLNAAGRIAATIGAVRANVPEIVVADGGSSDATAKLASAAGANMVTAPRGRGHQLAAGAAGATQPWLLFLHADTALGAGWAEEVRAFIDVPDNAEKAAAFRLVLDDPGPAARRVEWLARWRARMFGLPYGDQGLLISRRFYDAVGGFRPIPLMEDVDLVRRIGKRRLRFLQTPAVTSAERYRRNGWWARPARNLVCLCLYFLGVPPRAIARLYG
jgi:rSAM/selenodomain-associated transferase 2